MEKVTAKQNELVGVLGMFPQELLRAIDTQPINLYRVAQTLPDPNTYAVEAEKKFGLPKSMCFWFKCAVRLVRDLKLRRVALMLPGLCPYGKFFYEFLLREQVEVILFEHPMNHDKSTLRIGFEKFLDDWDLGWQRVEHEQRKLEDVREAVRTLDMYTYKGNISGFDNYAWLHACVDFWKQDDIRNTLSEVLSTVKKEETTAVRLAYLGGPCAVRGFHNAVEYAGGKIVVNDFQLEEACLGGGNLTSVLDNCTLLYSTFDRVGELSFILKEREVEGLILYSQKGCNRDFQHALISQELGLPSIVLAGDTVENLSEKRFDGLKKFIGSIRR